jgi:hypothetical protein
MVRFSSSFLTTAVLVLTANAASLKPSKSKYPSPSMATSGPNGATKEELQLYSTHELLADEASPAATAPTASRADVGDDSFTKLFNNLNHSWTKLQIDVSATIFGVTRDILDSGIVTDFTIIIMDQLQQTIYGSAQHTSSDWLRAVLAATLQPAPTPSPLDIRVVEPEHWQITTYMIAMMIDPAYNEHATHAYVDPCNLSKYDLGLLYGLFFADRFWQSPHAPVCPPRPDTCVNFWKAPRQFISNVLTNDNEQELYDTFIPMTELKAATSQFGADQIDSFRTKLYDLPPVVTQWLFNKIESTKKRLIHFGWSLIETLMEYCFGMATATYQEAMTESFGTARDWLVAFVRDWFRKLTEYSCGAMTTLDKNSALGAQEAIMRAVNAAHEALSAGNGYGITAAFLVILAAALLGMVYNKQKREKGKSRKMVEPTTRSSQGYGETRSADHPPVNAADGNGIPPTPLLYTPE